ncbi:MAG: hypothetical protein A2V67_11830 [Deltaproteobacteria bacterium RBG_13_61_14]|nr:MAG: hypothetical protein A2V67_11830 [Deltaproteobacteria bacterium RBG_13_61_14]
MKRFGIATLVMGLCMGLCLGFSSPASAQSLPGAFYIGDADGNGVIGVPDMNALNLRLNGKPYGYLNVKPSTGETQELDGNCLLGVPDKNFLNQWLNNKWTIPGGHPDSVAPVSTSIIIPEEGVDISVTTPDNLGVGMIKSGWGVTFRVESGAGLCSGALIEALNGGAVPTSGPEGFDYTMDGCMLGGGDDGYATVKILPGTCVNGDSVEIYPWVKRDAISGALGQRLPADILPTASIRGVVRIGVLPCDLVSLTINGPTNIFENAVQAYTATCTYVGAGCSIFSDGCTQAGGVAWDAPGGDLSLSSSDPLSITVQANDIPCGDGGNGTVSGSASFGLGSDTDLVNVIVDNDDNRTGITASVTNINENQTLPYTVSALYGLTACEDVTGTASVSGDCSGVAGSGSITGNNVCGNAEPAGTCSINEGLDSALPVTLHDDGDTIFSTLIAPDPLNISETQSQQFTLLRTWTDSCTDNLTATAGWGVTPGDCSTAGSITSGGLYTAADVDADCAEQVTTSTPVAGNSPVTVNVSAICIPISMTCTVTNIDENETLPYTCTDNCGADVTADTTVSDDCTSPTGPGSIRGNDVPCGDEPAGTCSIDHATLGSGPVTLHDDGDVQTDMLCSINTAIEGVDGSYTCQAIYNTDLCQDVTALTAMVGAVCSGPGGNYTCSEVCGDDDPADSTINQGGLYPQAVAVGDDGDLITDTAGLPGSILEGSSQAVACQYVWGLEGTCNDTDDICTADLSETSGNCALAAGNLSAPELCGDDNPPDCSLASQAPNETVDVVDDGDFVSSVDLTPAGPLDKNAGTTEDFYCVGTWNEGCTNSEVNNQGVPPDFVLTVNLSGATVDDATGIYTAGSTTGVADNLQCAIASVNSNTVVINVTGAVGTCALSESTLLPGNTLEPPTAAMATNTAEAVTEVNNWTDSPTPLLNGAPVGSDGQNTVLGLQMGSPITLTGNSVQLYPTAKTVSDTTNDIVNGFTTQPWDLRSTGGVLTTNLGSYWVEILANQPASAERMEVTNFNVSAIPDGAVVSAVTLRVVCGNSYWYSADYMPTNPYIQYNTGSGWNTSSIICWDSTTGYNPEATQAVSGITTKSGVQNLLVAFDMAGYPVAGTTRWAGINYVYLNVTYATPVPGKTLAMGDWDTSKIPGGATITGVTLESRYATGSAYAAGDQIMWDLDGGPGTGTGINLNANQAAWVVETASLGALTLSEIGTLDVWVTNSSATVTNTNATFDYLRLNVAYTTGGSGPLTEILEGEIKDYSALITWADETTEPAVVAAIAGCAASDNGDGTGTLTGGEFGCGVGGTCSVSCTGVVSGNPDGNVDIPVNNDDFILAMDETPEGPLSMTTGQSQDFYCAGLWSDGCTNSESNPLGVAPAYDRASTTCPTPGTIGPVTGLYTGGTGGDCTEELRCTISGLSDSETANLFVPSCDLTALDLVPQVGPGGGITLTEGQQQQFTTSCSYAGPACSPDPYTDDCTLAGGVSWTILGNLIDLGNGLVEADQVPCGAGGSGSVQVTASYGHGVQSDTTNVTVDNNDGIDTEVLVCPSIVVEGEAFNCVINRIWSDECTDNVPATGSTCSLPCTGSDGAFAAGQIPCGAGGSCVITLTGMAGSPQTVTINNDDIKSAVTVLPGSITCPNTGCTQDFYAYLAWSDGCTDPDDAGGWSKSGNCTGSAVNSNGVYTLPDQGPSGGFACDDLVTKTDNPATPDSAEVSVDGTARADCSLQEMSAPQSVNVFVNSFAPAEGSCLVNETTADCYADLQGIEGGTGQDNTTCQGLGAANANWRVDGANTQDVSSFDTLNVTAIPDGAVITSVVLRGVWSTQGGYVGPNCLQWSTNECATLVNSTICPDLDTTTWQNESQDITATRAWTKTMLGNMNIYHYNNDAGDNDNVYWDLIRVEVGYVLLAPFTSLDEGQTKNFSALITWEDTTTSKANLTTLDSNCSVVDGAGGTGSITAAQIPCGAGTCQVQCDEEGGLLRPDGTVTIPINNDDTLLSAVITPGSASIFENQTQQFQVKLSWDDGCTEDLTSSAGWALSGGNCTNSSISSGGLFTAGDYSGTTEPACNTTVVTTTPAADNQPVVIVHDDDGTAPVFIGVFPLDTPTAPANDRFRLNAHPDQGLTLLLDPTPARTPTSCTVTCGGLSYTCNVGLFPDVDCTAPSNHPPLSTVTCTTISCTNASGAGSFLGVNTFVTGLVAAPATGGFGGGYIGANTYDRSTGVDPGSLKVQLVDWDTRAATTGKAYVQRIQNAVTYQNFTTLAGLLNLASGVPGYPLAELTVGLKCGATRCPDTMAAQYNNYMYKSWHDVDARDIILTMELMPSAKGVAPPSEINPALFPGDRYRRYVLKLTGTLTPAEMNTIYPGPTSLTARVILAPPVHLRAGFILMALKGTANINMDYLLMGTDDNISIALCLVESGNMGLGLEFALPPNLVTPEIYRTYWWQACATWTANPGKTDWKSYYWTSQPSERRVMMVFGVYANASNFSLAGGLDLFQFPMYVCWLGTQSITVPANILTGDRTLTVNLRREWDLREQVDGFTPTDPDPLLDRRTQFLVGPALPVDPAREQAALQFSWIRRVANASDSELQQKGLVPAGTWDKRFVRNSITSLMGVDSGWSTGMIVFGLQLNTRINDHEWTSFAMAYMQSTTPRGGNRDLRYWSGHTADSEESTRILNSIDSRWTDPDFSTQPLERGGPTNYAAIFIMMRGGMLEQKMAARDKVARTITNPGTIISVVHAGPMGFNTVDYYQGGTAHLIAVNEFMNVPRAISPTPEGYQFPGPQWTSYTADPDGYYTNNRNSELERVLTGGGLIATDSASGNRRYFEFTSPSTLKNASRKAHQWKMTVAEPGMTFGMDKWSAKKPVQDSDGVCANTSPGTLNDNLDIAYNPARFKTQGVRSGDALRIMKCTTTGCTVRTYTVQSALSETQIQITADWLGADSGLGSRRYFVWRRTGATPLDRKKGECVIDQWFGGGPGDYACKSNTFMQIEGAVKSFANIRVHIPALTPGYATLSGTTGYIPDLYEGIDPTGTLTPKAKQLEWAVSMSAMNTGLAMYGGLGGFDWNNQDFVRVETKVQLNVQEGWFYQTQ